MTWPAGYTLLPGLPGGIGAYAYAVSADGLVVVGEADDADGDPHAVYWTLDGGIVDLGLLPSGQQYCWANAVNDDGSVIVGIADDASWNDCAFRWTVGTGMVSLGLPLGSTHSVANGVSGDGSIIVGFANPAPYGGDLPMRWTSGTGIVFLPDTVPVAIGVGGGASAISADGTIIVGDDAANDPYAAVRWPDVSTIEVLSAGATSYTESHAYAASSDGAVIVGGTDTSNSNAYRWTAATGRVDLGFLSGGSTAQALGVSADGATVIGRANDATSNRGFIWTAATGMVAMPLLDGVVAGDDFSPLWISGDAGVVVGKATITGAPTGGNGQHPAHFAPTLVEAAAAQRPAATMFGTVTTGICSFWLHDAGAFVHNHHQFGLDFDDNLLGPALYYGFSIGFDNSGTLGVAVIRQNSPGTMVQFQASAYPPSGFPAECAVHCLLSFDFSPATQRLQFYANDAAWTPSVGAPTVPGIPAPSFGSSTLVSEGFGNGLNLFPGWLADLWFGTTASFVDLSVAANRRKFINADLTPVDLGSAGQNPFGTAPQLYQTMPNASDPISAWFTNRGTAGGTFAIAGADIRNDGDPCSVTTAVDTAWVYSLSPPVAVSELPDDQIYLAWSDDSGHSFGNPVGQTMGGVGGYETQLQWLRLGMARGRVFELKWSVTNPTALMGAWIDTEDGET